MPTGLGNHSPPNRQKSWVQNSMAAFPPCFKIKVEREREEGVAGGVLKEVVKHTIGLGIRIQFVR